MYDASNPIHKQIALKSVVFFRELEKKTTVNLEINQT